MFPPRPKNILFIESSIIKDVRKACSERMVIQVVASVFGDCGYYYNLSFLRGALERDEVAFIGEVNNHAPETFVFDNKTNVYNFTRSAMKEIRDNMTNHLFENDLLPGLQSGRDKQKIKEPFEHLFSNSGYKASLDQVGQRRVESMHMLIFNGAYRRQPYVAHVNLTCNSRRAGDQLFTVYATLTCQRFTYFPLQEEDFEAVLQALQNLHVDDQPEE